MAELGGNEEKAVAGRHKEKEYRFCSPVCAELFKTNPEKYLQGAAGLIECPTCSAEQPRIWAGTLTLAGEEGMQTLTCPACGG